MTRVGIRVDGGFGAFPGLTRHTTIDLARLPAEERQRLAVLLEQARPHLGEASRAPADGAADLRTYRLTVEDGDVAEYAVTEPVADPRVRELIEVLLAQRRRGTP